MKGNNNTVVVIWIDWYAYHIARFRALAEHNSLRGRMTGIELVGGAGVHKGFVYREKPSDSLPVTTIAPEASWSEIGQRRLAVEVWKKLEELQPSVVLVPGYYTAPGLAAALWSKFRRRKSILMTESTQADHARTGWRERMKSLLLRGLFDGAVAGGSAHVRYLQALHFPLDRIGCKYDVVDNRFFASGADRARADRQGSGGNLPADYFLYVGRLSPEKNVDGLIRAFAEYRRKGGRWSLILAGGGPQRAFLEALAATLDVSDCVQFAGHKNSAGLIPYYAFARCFVLPSKREPWGLVVNEAMAAGLPVIVSSRCGCAEDLVVDGANGHIFDPEKPHDLERALSAIDQTPKTTLAGMGAASREIIAGFSPESWADEVARIVAA
jgi:1,2-diacylglycerol 3-alpha-glucosyltransferase